MKTLTLKTFALASSVAVLATLGAVPAAADTGKVDYSNLANFESTKGRDQVREEYMRAVKEGNFAKATKTEVDADSPALPKFATSNIQRPDIYAETVEWLRTKTTAVGMGE